MIVSRFFLEREMSVRQKLQRQLKHAFYVQKRFSENRAVHETMWKNVVEPDRPQMTI